MRVMTIVLLLVLLAGCQAPTPARPTAVPSSPNVPSPTASVGAAASPSPLQGSPVSTTPAASTSLECSTADLRNEFKADLSRLDSPTIYRMDLTLSPALDQIGGTESILYTNRTGGTLGEVYLRLFANLEGKGNDIRVSNLRAGGKEATNSLEASGSALRIQLSDPLAARQSVRLDLDFSVTIPISNTGHYADFTDNKGIVTLPTIYPLVPAHDAAGWHIEVPPSYGDLVYADSSCYDVTITAPTTTTIIASGIVVDRKESGSNTTWHYVGAPMRDFDIDASPVMIKSSQTVSDVTVNSYYLSADEADGRAVLGWAVKAMQVYQKRIGPYPFTELDVVETPTTAGGIEYPGLVVISSELYSDPQQSRTLEFATVHEVAHQWFYSVVGDDQVNTPWMDESLVQMVALLYEEDANGPEAASFVRQRLFQAGYDRAKQENEDLPIGLPVSAYTDRQYAEIVYSKGPLFFDAVRKQIGDDKFNQFLSTYFSRFKYKVARPEDMLQVLKEVGGPAIQALYDQWVLGK